MTLPLFPELDGTSPADESAAPMPSQPPVSPTVADPQRLDPARLPLWGSRLIEASAGTGKTWTIAALYLRLVLGHGTPDTAFARPLAPPDILVMTFTRAATRELSDRIRARLLEAAQAFRLDPADATDPLLVELLASYPDAAARRQAAHRLALAAEGMDGASIHTIDAWCQRALREHAFDSGSLFDETLAPDETALQQEAVRDYWRQQCYPLTADALTEVLAVWPGVAELQQDLKAWLGQDLPPTWAAGTLQDAMAQARQARAQALAALRADWQGAAEDMLGYVESQQPAKAHGWNGQKFKLSSFQKWTDALKDWARGQGADLPDLKTGWQRLTPEGLADCRAVPGPMPEPPAAFARIAGLQRALQTLPSEAEAARRHAAAAVKQRLQWLKAQAGTFGFADLLERLDIALQGPSGAGLRARLLTRHPVALIDEFQDTSPLQYRIFEAVYGASAQARDVALLLIGDPKQSIYGFRGADIHSYLRARHATAGRHYVLQVNHRSTQAMVDAVNHAFAQAEDRRPAGALGFRTAAAHPLPFIPVQARGRAEQWVDAGDARPALTLCFDPTVQSAKAVQRRFADRCAEQIVQWLNDPSNGLRHDDGRFERLRPRDIAVLVRTGQEADAIRRALQRRAVASVYLSDRDSVFDSAEARDLLHWLRAVAEPQQLPLVRAAFSLDLLGRPLPELFALFADDEAFDRQTDILRELQRVWQAQGVLAMLRQTLHRFELAARWLRQPGGERRLTNVLHLAELLQTAGTTLDGEHALIRWLQHQIDEPEGQGDEQVVRLESDADLVKVVTVHKSKGLEYPVVCLPFATSLREVTRRQARALSLPREGGGRTLVLTPSDDDLAQADRERLREDLRLLYVAMTRPRHGLWLGAACLKVGNSPACQTHKSALGYLAGGDGVLAPEAWRDRLRAWLGEDAHRAWVEQAEPERRVTLLQRDSSATPLVDPAPYNADFDRRWTIASYSRLTRDLSAPTSPLAALQALRPADDEQLAGVDAASAPDAPWLSPHSLSDPAAQPGPEPAAGPIWHSFARGPISGNFLHDQLEWLCHEGFALGTEAAVAARLRQRCERAGHGAQADALVAWLQAVLATPLPGPGVALQDIPGAQAEMEFWLPLQQLATDAVDQLCHSHLWPGQPRPALQASQLHGMLMGFADLVFEHDGRYWVLDYKSNHLGPDDAAYHPDALRHAVLQHRYDVQAVIYQLALHRLLQHRLGTAYAPERQLGGALFLFLRGIHGPAHGVCLVAPSLPLLDALSAMLHPPEVST